MDNQPITPPQQEPLQPTQPQQSSSNISWLKTLSYGFSLVSFGIAIGIGGYFLAMQKTKPASQNQQVASPTTLPAEVSTKAGDQTANWKTYINSKYNFSIKYPSDLVLEEQTSDIFLLNLSFKDPKENNPFLGRGYNLEVTKPGKLEDTVVYRRWQIEIVGHVADEIKKETRITKEGFEGMRLAREISNSGEILSKKETRITKEGSEGMRLDYEISNSGEILSNSVVIISTKSYSYTIQAKSDFIDQILSTFKFTDKTNPTPTCRPRPACLDTNPRCLIAETPDMCPPVVKKYKK